MERRAIKIVGGLMVAACGVVTVFGVVDGTAPTSPAGVAAPVETTVARSSLVSPSTANEGPDPTVSTMPDTTAVPRELRSATLSFSGDVLLHSRVWREGAARAAADDPDGYDFTSMFGPVADRISAADWAVCHLEVNLAADNSRLSSFPVFRGPGAIAADLASVGFDSCSTASNHSLDGRTTATFETIEVLEAAGLHHTGTARSPSERERSPHIEVNGIRIAHLAYTYWFNGFELPDDQPWAANQIDEEQILADAEAARLDGAEVVVLSLHWGDQYRHAPNTQQVELGPRLLSSPDIDLIIGHHAHVVQPIERIDGEWLVYGLGNFLSNQTQLPRRDELIVEVSIQEQPDGSFVVDQLTVVPVFLDLDTFQILPSTPTALVGSSPTALESTLTASFDRVLAILQTGSGWEDLRVDRG